MVKYRFRMAQVDDLDFLISLFNSQEFTSNGIRAIEASNVSQASKDGFLFNFDSGNGFFVSIDECSGKLVGAVKVSTYFRNQYYSINGGVCPNVYATNCSRELMIYVMRFMFINYPLERIEINIVGNNARSVRFHQKLGFYLEGVKRKAWFCNGVLQDQLVFSMLRSEFFERFSSHNIGHYSISRVV